MAEAVAHRAENGHEYKIMGRIGNEPSAEVRTTCPSEFRKDSGTVLVAQAHEEGYDAIYVCGYDLGGPDLLSPDLHTQSKAVWVRRWRQILRHYGSERVRFVGYDHMPYLLSRDPTDAYEKRYKAGLPHIPDPDYIALHGLFMGQKKREGKVARVRWLVRKPGWETEYSDAVAQKLADKGQVEIIGAEEAAEPETKATARMNVATLREIAKARGIEGADDITRADLLDLLRD
jgi:hypothetical protein